MCRVTVSRAALRIDFFSVYEKEPTGGELSIPVHQFECLLFSFLEPHFKVMPT